MEKIYRKQNSFLKFFSLNQKSQQSILQSIKIALNDKKNLKTLSKYQMSIINFVKKDNNLSKLWLSPMYNSLRHKHLSSNRTSAQPCNRCKVI